MVWTPDQVTKLVAEVGGIVGSMAIIIQSLHNNKTITLNNANNTHETLMHLASTTRAAAGNGTAPASGVDVTEVSNEPVASAPSASPNPVLTGLLNEIDNDKTKENING